MKTKLSTLVLSAVVVGAALLIVPSFTSDGGGGGSQAAIEKSPSGHAQARTSSSRSGAGELALIHASFERAGFPPFIEPSALRADPTRNEADLAPIQASFERAGIPTSIAPPRADSGVISDVSKMISALVRGALERAGLSEPQEPPSRHLQRSSLGSR